MELRTKLEYDVEKISNKIKHKKRKKKDSKICDTHYFNYTFYSEYHFSNRRKNTYFWDIYV